MIRISGATFEISGIINDYPENSIERQLLHTMSTSNETYQYDNLNQLKFELNYRKEIVASARDLNNSNMSFAGFVDSTCNSDYWIRSEAGGFELRETVKPSEAIEDIFVNGDQYATECATALVIVYYKGLLNVYGEKLFNKLFTRIYLMSWEVNEPLLMNVSDLKDTADILLGDRKYFSNPDHDPSAPEWQGENVIVLPDSLFYGHGIGITTADEILKDLDSRRREGSHRPAHLLESAGRPDFKQLANVLHNPSLADQRTQLVWKPFPSPITSI